MGKIEVATSAEINTKVRRLREEIEKTALPDQVKKSLLALLPQEDLKAKAPIRVRQPIANTITTVREQLKAVKKEAAKKLHGGLNKNDDPDKPLIRPISPKDNGNGSKEDTEVNEPISDELFEEIYAIQGRIPKEERKQAWELKAMKMGEAVKWRDHVAELKAKCEEAYKKRFEEAVNTEVDKRLLGLQEELNQATTDRQAFEQALRDQGMEPKPEALQGWKEEQEAAAALLVTNADDRRREAERKLQSVPDELAKLKLQIAALLGCKTEEVSAEKLSDVFSQAQEKAKNEGRQDAEEKLRGVADALGCQPEELDKKLAEEKIRERLRTLEGVCQAANVQPEKLNDWVKKRHHAHARLGKTIRWGGGILLLSLGALSAVTYHDFTEGEAATAQDQPDQIEIVIPSFDEL